MLFDQQIIQSISQYSDLIVLRASLKGESEYYSFRNIVTRIKESDPSINVLTYAWVTRAMNKGGRIEARVLKWGDVDKNAVSVRGRDNKKLRYYNLGSKKVRNTILAEMEKADRSLGADGFAIDLMIRRPKVTPKVLAKECQVHENYCQNYADGAAVLFSKLKKSLGEQKKVIFNGLFNTYPGQMEEQASLLEFADGMIVEYFGMKPKAQTHSFNNDILPYIRVISNLPNKPIYFFGRGSWEYTNYKEDYLWQRYLYACFLLAKRENDLFKYHASFQVPAHRGRSGGLSIYQDWFVDLGSPLAAFAEKKGILSRQYQKGLVLVAPDEGIGGQYQLNEKKYDLEGRGWQGVINLKPSQSLILYDNKGVVKSRPVKEVISPTRIASWGWINATLHKTQEGKAFVHLKQMPKELLGEHDLLLDYQRSLNPYKNLLLQAELLNDDAKIQVVAEIDDPEKVNHFAVLEISKTNKKDDRAEADAIYFRSRRLKNSSYSWPLLPLTTLGKTSFNLDGLELFKKVGLSFKRWAYVRFSGDAKLYSVVMQ